MNDLATPKKLCSSCLEDKDFSLFRLRSRGNKKYLNSKCRACENKYQYNLYHSKSPDERSEIHKRYRSNNPDYKERAKLRYSSEKRSRCYLKYHDKNLKNTSLYYEKNKNKILKRISQYRKNNKYRCNFWLSIRRAKKKMATPKWLTDIHKIEMKEIYKKAQDMTRNTKQQYEVDHIIPLENKNICGLHVPWNLRVVLKSENRKKSNKIIGEIYE